MTKDTAHGDRSSDSSRIYEQVNVSDVLIAKGDDKLDAKTVSAIAESIHVFDLLHPIAVRRHTEVQANGKKKVVTVLVAGAHRLAAMKLIGRATIPCCYIKDDETYAQLVHLGENIFRKRVTLLQKAEGIVMYLQLASARVNYSGQVGQKSKLGRPPAGIALAARMLPLVGRSEEARRKVFDRAIKINKIEPEAKKAAIKRRLSNNQHALLSIAKCCGVEAQLKKVAELAKLYKHPRPTSKKSGKKSSREDSSSDELAVHGASLQPDQAKSMMDENEDKNQPSQIKTTFEEMVVLWKRECKEKWAYLPAVDRERFIEMQRRAKRKVRGDVVEFVADVFRGRKEVEKNSMFGMAAIHGFTKISVQKVLRELGYKSKRKGHGLGSKWTFLNSNRNWEQHQLCYNDAELTAAANAQPNPADARAEKFGFRATIDEYLMDL